MEKLSPRTALIESRNKILAAISELLNDELEKVPIEGTWTVKDILGHISAWDTTCIGPLSDFIQGAGYNPTLVKDHLAWNTHQSKKRQSLTLDAIWEEFNSTRSELLTLIDSISSESLQVEATAPWGETGTLEQIILGLAWHENEHAETINKWRLTRVNQ